MTPQKRPMNQEDVKKRATELFLHHYEYVRLVSFREAPIPDLREDIAQEAYIVFIENAERWNLDDDVRPLLRSITKKIAMNHYRKYVRSMPEELRILAAKIQEESSKRLDPNGDSSEMDSRLSAMELCIGRLTGHSRVVFDSHYNKMRTFADIAREAGIKLNTIHRMMSRVRLFLHDCVENVLRGRNES